MGVLESMNVHLMSTGTDWKRMWKPPRRALKRSNIHTLTPQGKYLAEQSRKRFEARSDVRAIRVSTADFGRFESFRFVVSNIQGAT